MRQKKLWIASAAALLFLVLVVPQVQLAGARGDATNKMSAGLVKQLSSANADEMVTAIVKMDAVANFNGIRGVRGPVFAELRRSAGMSQMGLVNHLNSPTVSNKVEIVRQFWIDNIVLVRATRDVIHDLAARDDVKEVFENYTVTLPPREGRTDGPQLSTAQQNQLWDSATHIGAKQVWSAYGLRGAGVRVGGLDTGVDIGHPDIAGKMITTNPADPTYPGGWAEFDGDGNIIPGSVPHDSDEHGTHTSGSMVGGNASGYDVGVAPDANLMHGLVIPSGSGSFAQVAGGMEWIIDPDGNPLTDDGAQVVNMSLGGTGTHDAMVVPTDNMVAAGVFPSFSIGNSGPGSGTTGSPGNVPTAYGVGATDSTDTIAGFSSRGPVTWNTPPHVGTFIKPDMSAPGVKIYSTVPGGGWEWTSPAGDWSGTSMAAPHLSGAVALMYQANPTLSVDMVKQLLMQTAIDLGDPGKDNDYGWGRVDAFAAVSAALVGLGTVDGTVYSSMGGTLDYALVRVVDTGQRVYTNATGDYTLQLVAGDHDLEFSKFGYETQTVTVTIVADETVTQDVTLTQLPSGTIAGAVTDNTTGMGVAADIAIRLTGVEVAWTSTDPVTGAYSVSLPVGTYDVVFNPTFPYPLTIRNDIDVFEATTTTLDVTMMAAQVLVVDDDAGDAFEAYFEQAILAAGRSYLTVTTPPTAADMAQFESVVWLTGNDYTTTLTSADQAELGAFLDGGGRLFISGQDIGYDIKGDAFYANYLHATFVQDNVGLGSLIGDAASAVGQGFSFNIQGGDGAGNQAYPSEIDPIGPGLPAFYYDPAAPAATATAYKTGGDMSADGITSSGTAGLSVDTGMYKLVYFAFGFEAIDNGTVRGDLMTRILDWLQGYPEIAHTPLTDTEDTESPYEIKAIITSDYFALDPSSFAVMYDVGGPAMTIAMYPTGVPDEYVAYIPQQPLDTQVNYYITASDVAGHTTTHPLGAPANRHTFWVAPDETPPEVVHYRYFNTNDLEGPYSICAMVTDNAGVESVYLMYAKNEGMYHRVEMMPMGDDMYCGDIPGPTEVGDIFAYHILAMDESYSGNVTRVPETGDYEFEIVEEFVWDFEFDDGGFVQAGDIWEWGSPTSGPGDAHSGVNVWATILGGDYPSSSDATLDIPPITLSASKPYAMMSFWHWYYNETNYDGGNVKVSTDGGATWDVVEPFGGYDGTASSANAGIPGEPCFTGYNNDFWQEELFDLSAYAGQQVMVRFHFGSDGSVQRTGWYVDDVRLRSTDTDDLPPIISNVVVPQSTFDSVGPYEVSCTVTDPLSGVDAVTLYYSTDGGVTYVAEPMGPGSDPFDWTISIPGQANGTRVSLYIEATDTASPPNTASSPAAAPATTYGFSILPSAPILVLQMSSSATSLDMLRDALEANGHVADYWYTPTQGWLGSTELSLYRTIILDETGSLSTTERADLAVFLDSGVLSARKQIFAMGRDLSYSSSARPFMEEYMRAAYVQDNPGWRELTGEPGEFIGAEEVFTISGLYPDELQRSSTYPGGELVYRYTGEGSLSDSRSELEGAYEKDGKDWDGVMPFAPISLDAGAGIKYAGATYRSVYFSFNFNYVQEEARRAGIMDRALAWLSAPQIVHAPLADTEDTLSAYTVLAQVYSETLDPGRVKLTYDVGAGAVIVVMGPTGNPDEFAADIPPQLYGTTVNYFIEAANTDGTMSTDPTGAPGNQHTFQVNADLVPPEIVHSPFSSSADQTGPYTIAAMVTDNVGVDPSAVFLTYNVNGAANTTIPMADMGGDMYQADIPGPTSLGDVVNYYISARDNAEVPNHARDPLAGFHSFEIVDYYAWDFEAGDGGFSATGPDWEWGAPTTGPGDANSGVNVWATKLGGDYSASTNSKLDIPPVQVPGGTGTAQLSFWHWFYAEGYSPYDGGNVKISTDGGATWTILTPDVGYNGTAPSGNAGIPGEPCFTGYDNDYWHKVTFNLTPYIGQMVTIRFHFGSDSSVQKVGWYVDDVRIESVSDTEGPVFVSTSIPASTFDTVGPYTVSAEIIDAMSGVASATMNYSTDDGVSWTPVLMSLTGTPDEYAADIPGQASGTRINVYFEATDNSAFSSIDPAGAPGTSYSFGIMPAGDYLVLLGGGSHTPATTFQMAFSAIGRTADIWDWDDLGMPTVEILQAYSAIIIDESWYLDSTQMATLGTFLDTDLGGSLNQVFFMGRDMSYGSSARPWMEQYTGAAYVKDDPGWRELTSTPGDPIGADDSFTISGGYPDELTRSTTFTGGEVVYKYSAVGAAYSAFSNERNAREAFEKDGKTWDPRMWPMAPSGPDSAAAVSYVGTTHASVYFAFNFNYIQEDTRRSAILERALDWLAAATVTLDKDVALDQSPANMPDALVLGQNYPNPFNPTTRIQVGIPAGHTGAVALKVYNVRGQLVKTIFEGVKPPGFHTFDWDGMNAYGTPVSSGIYFARFQAGQTNMTRKMVLLK